MLNRRTLQLKTLQVYMYRAYNERALGNIYCDLNAKFKGQIMYFIVNASPKPLDAATSTFADV